MQDMALVVVGSIGLDTIETKFDRQEDVLGGSVSYACAAASFFTKTGMVGVAGTDFPDACMDCYRHFGIDLEGLQLQEGSTFRWSGVYEDDMINRRTLSTCLNVFADFMPDLPANYRATPYVLLGNISPELQLHVLSQVSAPRFVLADTMDLWINIADEPLQEVIRSVNMLALNDGEARLLTQEHNLKGCARRILDMGPDYVVIKKGEHGAFLVGKDVHFSLPAYPVDDVVDPTGAGDSFAGGFMGYIAAAHNTDPQTLKRAMLYGTVTASFCVEGFSIEELVRHDRGRVEARFNELLSITSF